MSFSTDLASLMANQLSRFVTLNPHQLAGQVENLDFWLGQVRHALEALDGYAVRFVRMEGAQERYVSASGTSLPLAAPAPGNVTVTPLKALKKGIVTQPAAAPQPPYRIPDRELQKARRELLDTTSRFLARCRDEGLISAQKYAAALAGLGLPSA